MACSAATGNRIAHNLMHDSYSSAMRIEGNDHLVEFNEVHSVLLESDDQGGVDMWGDPTYRGNVFRYNYFHHIGNGLGTGQAGIRLDDAICGTLVYGNLFHRCSDGHFGGVQVHGGNENDVENNNRDLTVQKALANLSRAALPPNLVGPAGRLDLAALGTVLESLPVQPIPLARIGLYEDDLRTNRQPRLSR
jgi:hypothetical protein